MKSNLDLQVSKNEWHLSIWNSSCLLEFLGLDHCLFPFSHQVVAYVSSWNSHFDLIHLFTRSLLDSHCFVPLEWKPFLQLIWSSVSPLLWDLTFVLNHTSFYFLYKHFFLALQLSVVCLQGQSTVLRSHISAGVCSLLDLFRTNLTGDLQDI